ncbi:8-oxo-dGTP diphosphatase [Lachnospiraceae bacterium]|nr:8-oxo-dGTP diphosphatase [Lachnospiraceae bacterium]
MYRPETEEEKAFIESYDSAKYEKPSVTADIVIFTLSEGNELSLLLIKRGGYPYKGKWAIPGGFVGINESLTEAASRELHEETSLKDMPIEQFGTFGAVERDPRMRVISVAYMAFVPKRTLHYHAGDDASDVQLFKIRIDIDGMMLVGDRNVIREDDLAFDHAEIIKTAIKRLRNRIEYTDDAFKFLEDDQSFTIYELKKIYETVTGKAEDTGNFRRMFLNRYVKTGLVAATGEKDTDSGHRSAALYRKLN